MPKINLWNTISIAQTGRLKLQDSGRELFGTVVKHGVNDKTVTVRISSRIKNTRYIKWLYSNKSKQVHDELNYCVTGDKVIIGNCAPITKSKTYYVKSIVQAFGRPITPKGDLLPPEYQIKEGAQQTEGLTQKQTVFQIPNPVQSKFISGENLRHGSQNILRKQKKKSKSQLKYEKSSEKKKLVKQKRKSQKSQITQEDEKKGESKSDRQNRSQKDSSQKE